MPAESTPLQGGSDKKRVVGKNAWSPGCSDCPFAVLFIANIIFVIVFYFIWVGGGCHGFPSSDDINDLHGIDNETMASLSDATVLTSTYSSIFALIWTIIYLGVMKIAAFWLIVGMNIIGIIITAVFGVVWMNYALTCKDFAPECSNGICVPMACSNDQQTWAWIGAIVGYVVAALMLLWLCCIWRRIEFTAKMLSAVSGVLMVCPGTILVAFVAAIITVVWWGIWMGAYVQATVYAAGGENKSVPYGTAIGVLFGMLICVWWGHKVFLNIAHMTSCHVICSWYFDPETANEGMPCCKPVTMTGLKRSTVNYLGSIAFGSLIVAILEAIYYTCKIVMDRVAANSNIAVQIIVCCFLCLLKCIKNCIEWLTEWAYCYIALYGVGFIEAGGKVFKMLADSGMGAVAQSTLVGPVLWLGCLCGAAIGVGAGYLTLQSHDVGHDYHWTQPVIGAVIGFVSCSVGLSCVDAGNKAIYVCYVDEPTLMGEREPSIKSYLDNNDVAKEAQAKASTIQP